MLGAGITGRDTTKRNLVLTASLWRIYAGIKVVLDRLIDYQFDGIEAQIEELKSRVEENIEVNSALLCQRSSERKAPPAEINWWAPIGTTGSLDP